MIPRLPAIDAWLAEGEARAPALRPGCEKRVIWADGPKRTSWSVVYVHGFSASRREVSPYSEEVARGLGANWFGTRLAGHGQDGAAMDRASLRQWRQDVAEAFALGGAIGERMLVVACSTGCTLVTLELADGAQADGAVMLSPNYGLRFRRLQVALDAPFAAHWVPLLSRGPKGPPAGKAGSGIWTSGYSARAYAPMAQSVRSIRRADLEHIRVPALFAFADEDQVVDPGLSAALMRRWGGPSRRLVLRPGPDDDPMAHVMAGDALSPGQTEGLVTATLDWVRGL